MDRFEKADVLPQAVQYTNRKRNIADFFIHLICGLHPAEESFALYTMTTNIRVKGHRLSPRETCDLLQV